MNFNIITLFPESIKSYFDSSILKRAQEKKIIKIKFVNPRNFAKDKHQVVDDKQFGGGPGMVAKVDVMARAIEKTKGDKIILLSPAGKKFNQEMARKWAKRYKNITLISGRYEGVDERVAKIFKAEKISIGDYVLTGGELPSAIIVDAVSRHLSGVLGKSESLEDERGVGIPVYTRPEVFEYKKKKYAVPKVLLTGHHKNIEDWRQKQIKK